MQLALYHTALHCTAGRNDKLQKGRKEGRKNGGRQEGRKEGKIKEGRKEGRNMMIVQDGEETDCLGHG